MSSDAVHYLVNIKGCKPAKRLQVGPRQDHRIAIFGDGEVWGRNDRIDIVGDIIAWIAAEREKGFFVKFHGPHVGGDGRPSTGSVTM